MMSEKKFRNIILLFLFLPFAYPGKVFSQLNDSVKIAMADELNRSMNELQLEGHNKPFYISYNIIDASNYTLSTTLGSVLYKSGQPERVKNIRVMVGGYEFNDESMDSQFNQSFNGLGDWSVPLGNDYYGVRRSLWATTDEVYRTAAKVYEENVRQYENQQEGNDKVQHRRFAKTPVTKISLNPDDIPDISAPEYEAHITGISALFEAYPDLEASGAIFSNSQRISYFMDSEGNDITGFENQSVLIISAKGSADDGSVVFDYKNYIASTPDQLPTREELSEEVKNMADNIRALQVAPVFKDSYSGPVLFLDEAVPFIFDKVINEFRASDIANPTPGYYGAYNSSRALDEKMGDRVVSNKLNIKLTPRMTSYKGTQLLGAYQVDSEGVVPDAEITLVEKGILKEVMTSRTLTKGFHKANGTNSGPGVVHVSCNDAVKKVGKLKDGLIELVKEEGLDYGIIIKRVAGGQANIYTIDQEGNEKFLRSAVLRGLAIKSFRKVAGALKEEKVYNLPSQGTAYVVSYIVPAGIILEDIEVEGFHMNPNSEVPLVENPLLVE